jgi:hypothetical protein
MAVYSFNNSMGGTQQNLTSTYKTILSATAATATLTSASIEEVAFGPGGAPNSTDCTIEYDLSAQTAAGTATSVTANALDPTRRSSGTVCNVNYTAEPTITANSSRIFIGLNQRATYRWVATPGSEIIIPATNNNGYALRSRSATYASTIDAMMVFWE